jgi:hypothetical protein
LLGLLGMCPAMAENGQHQRIGCMSFIIVSLYQICNYMYVVRLHGGMLLTEQLDKAAVHGLCAGCLQVMCPSK